MSLDSKQTEDRPISALSELVEFFRSAEQPSRDGMVGLEHEKLMMPQGGSSAVPYEALLGH